jgi:hypothetical protein
MAIFCQSISGVVTNIRLALDVSSGCLLRRAYAMCETIVLFVRFSLKKLMLGSAPPARAAGVSVRAAASEPEARIRRDAPRLLLARQRTIAKPCVRVHVRWPFDIPALSLVPTC